MSTLFVSDIHLDPARPALNNLFLSFLAQRAQKANACYILGDLFESWIGDDDDTELGYVVALALRRLVNKGVLVFFLHGNRDFLVGERFAAASGIQLLPETKIVELYEKRVLLLHGDMLCTSDDEYQKLRASIRDPAWQARFLGLSIAQRRMLAVQLRISSQLASQRKADKITDVNHEAVDIMLRSHGVQQIIHGHTHRPAIHEWILDGLASRRAVLGDWNKKRGVMLCCEASGWRLESFNAPN
jgi:UDP-2,3-diacylglucosamine hydrolase